MRLITSTILAIVLPTTWTLLSPSQRPILYPPTLTLRPLPEVLAAHQALFLPHRLIFESRTLMTPWASADPVYKMSILVRGVT